MSDLDAIVRVHNARLVMSIAERIPNLPSTREPPLLGVYLIALADAMRGTSDRAVHIAGALGKQRRRAGYDAEMVELELELARRALAEIMTDLGLPAHERLREVTRACALEATTRLYGD
jgi:hypothetical protein